MRSAFECQAGRPPVQRVGDGNSPCCSPGPDRGGTCVGVSGAALSDPAPAAHRGQAIARPARNAQGRAGRPDAERAMGVSRGTNPPLRGVRSTVPCREKSSHPVGVRIGRPRMALVSRERWLPLVDSVGKRSRRHRAPPPGVANQVNASRRRHWLPPPGGGDPRVCSDGHPSHRFPSGRPSALRADRRRLQRRRPLGRSVANRLGPTSVWGETVGVDHVGAVPVGAAGWSARKWNSDVIMCASVAGAPPPSPAPAGRPDAGSRHPEERHRRQRVAADRGCPQRKGAAALRRPVLARSAAAGGARTADAVDRALAAVAGPRGGGHLGGGERAATGTSGNGCEPGVPFHVKQAAAVRGSGGQGGDPSSSRRVPGDLLAER
ncbi:hypothetical protein GA0074695_0422 [Micromonospora viridifaciens]|uniref:Uncharacterized protein n=1 Tax=Micromonospora viridifaciens TaxID=1881 RepID=A0A1C4UEQ2_MICVI|nr:hypothetical protein GA0074695_0422 [Micromonospora viridifaciens]